MAYHVVETDGIEPRSGIPGIHRYVDDVVDLEYLSVQFVEVEPGMGFVPYHSHDEQEELFYVLDGPLHVETPEDVFVIESGDFFIAEPGSPLRPHNPSDAGGSVRALLVNAPNVDDFRPYEPED